MKLLAFTDFHASPIALKRVLLAAKKFKPDFLVCTGDITIFEHNLDWVLKQLDSMPKKVILIPGNHEEGPQFREICKRYKNLLCIDRASCRVGGKYLFLGYGGGGFSFTDPQFRTWSAKAAKRIKDGDIVILLTHQPPYGTKLDKIISHSCGNKDIRKFIEKYPIKLAISGHLHENFNARDKLGKTVLLNPGPYGTIVEL